MLRVVVEAMVQEECLDAAGNARSNEIDNSDSAALNVSPSSGIDLVDSSTRLCDTTTPSVPKIAKLGSFERIRLPIMNTVATVRVSADDSEHSAAAETYAQSNCSLEFTADWLRTIHRPIAATVHPLGLTYEESSDDDNDDTVLH